MTCGERLREQGLFSLEVVEGRRDNSPQLCKELMQGEGNKQLSMLLGTREG